LALALRKANEARRTQRVQVRLKFEDCNFRSRSSIIFETFVLFINVQGGESNFFSPI